MGRELNSSSRVHVSGFVSFVVKSEDLRMLNDRHFPPHPNPGTEGAADEVSAAFTIRKNPGKYSKPSGLLEAIALAAEIGPLK